MHRSTKRTQLLPDTDWTKEMYRLWHNWLGVSDESLWADDLKAEYAQAKSMLFENWWGLMHEKARPIHYGEHVFEEIQTVEHFKQDNCYPHDEYTFSSRIFRIEFWASKHVLHEELDKFIKLYHRDHETGHEGTALTNLQLTLTKKPTKRFVTTVETIWRVYELAEGWRNERRAKYRSPSLDEIGMKCGLRVKGSQYDDSRQLMAQTVSRYIKWGRQVAEHLNIGEFPIYNRKDDQ